jgi:hypothetical protein
VQAEGATYRVGVGALVLRPIGGVRESLCAVRVLALIRLLAAVPAQVDFQVL